MLKDAFIHLKEKFDTLGFQEDGDGFLKNIVFKSDSCSMSLDKIAEPASGLLILYNLNIRKSKLVLNCEQVILTGVKPLAFFDFLYKCDYDPQSKELLELNTVEIRRLEIQFMHGLVLQSSLVTGDFFLRKAALIEKSKVVINSPIIKHTSMAAGLIFSGQSVVLDDFIWERTPGLKGYKDEFILSVNSLFKMNYKSVTSEPMPSINNTLSYFDAVLEDSGLFHNILRIFGVFFCDVIKNYFINEQLLDNTDDFMSVFSTLATGSTLSLKYDGSKLYFELDNKRTPLILSDGAILKLKKIFNFI